MTTKIKGFIDADAHLYLRANHTVSLTTIMEVQKQTYITWKDMAVPSEIDRIVTMGEGLTYIRDFVSKDFLMSTPTEKLRNVGE